MAIKQHSNQKSEQYRPSTMPGFLISLYLILMFSFFPLFLSAQYTHARTDKYHFYTILSGVMIVSVVIVSLMDFFEGKRHHQADLRFKPITPTDVSFLCFYGFAAISTLISKYPGESFLGVFPNGGRNNGLLLMTVYLLVYLIITRRYSFKEYVIAVYLIFSSFVAFLAIINYFYIDLLGVYNGYIDLWKMFDGTPANTNVLLNFGSTLGNKNLISAFMCLFLPIAVMTFVVTKTRYLKIISGASICFAYCGLLCSDSTSGMLGLMVIVAVMAIFSARSYAMLKWYLLALTILFASSKLLRLFSYIMGDISKGFEFIQVFLIYSKASYIPLAVCAVLFILMQIFEKKLSPHYPKKTITITLIVLTVGGLCTGIGALIYYTFIHPEAELSKDLSGLLRFDENWGTHRGYYWIKSLEQYKSFDFLHKLFGYGPDSVSIVMESTFSDVLTKFNESSTDCVHNEFLNYFITQGVLGLLSYLAILGTVTVRAIRRAKNDPVILIFLSAVICCAVQSVVNLYQPITTPIFFIFLSITEALNRQTKPSAAADDGSSFPSRIRS